MSENDQQDNSKDTINELTELLEKDVMTSSGDENQFFTKKDMIGLTIRMSVVIVFALVLFFTGIFDDFMIVVTVVVMMGLVEVFTIYRNQRAQKKKITFPFNK